MKNCGIDGLQIAIENELNNYSQSVAESVKDICKSVAKSCVDDVKSLSPAKSGEYRKGWKAKKQFEDNENIRYRVCNSKKPFLTHLLENGHMKRGGTGRVEGIPHISIAEKRAVEKLQTEIKKAVEK